jgi:transposase-like protein
MPRKYDLEFKLEAVRMASEPGMTNRVVESRLGIGQGVLKGFITEKNWLPAICSAGILKK